MKTLNEMRELVKSGKAQVLTVDKVTELKGKEISTIYFGYAGQDGVDNFIVGDIINNKLHTDEGRNTCIYTEPYANGKFWCSDDDRCVYFVEG